MKLLDLVIAAQEFETIDSEKHLFYNTKTGEFDFYSDFLGDDYNNAEMFEDDVWIAAPSQRDIGEYDIMEDFANSVTDPRTNELLCIALEGKGAFRRFKDTLHRVDLTAKWYDFRRKAFVKIAREWCEENGIGYLDITNTNEPEPSQSAEHVDSEPSAIAVTLATLESHNHYTGDIERGVKIYNSGKVEFEERDPGYYWARVPHKGDIKVVTLTFSRDGRDLKKHLCDCSWQEKKPPVCRHVVAAVLAIQGGIVESKLTLGKTATAGTIVTDDNTAKTVGSGSLEVFATPMLIALMEQAACECLADCLDKGQTSVGSLINIEHIAASPIGAEITATATIDYVFGRKIEFTVTASDGFGEIGKGKHTRIVIDKEKLMAKSAKRSYNYVH
ncbi:MAG: SWIM zinc finger family protein [Clostridiales bacterium]|jgi:predicted thioesterase|nr:SWIM zinc finger family protein [Clostridiales bacterium]